MRYRFTLFIFYTRHAGRLCTRLRCAACYGSSTHLATSTQLHQIHIGLRLPDLRVHCPRSRRQCSESVCVRVRWHDIELDGVQAHHA